MNQGAVHPDDFINPFAKPLSHALLPPTSGICEKTVMIAGPMHTHNPDTHIKIESADVALHFLSNFGDQVTKLVFKGAAFDADRSFAISKHIAAFCPNLREIQVTDAGNHLIGGTYETFANVISASLQPSAMSELAAVHRIYPSVQRLTLALHQIRLPSSGSNVNALGAFMATIQQLRSLTLLGLASNQLLRPINANLPVLEELHIFYDAKVPLATPVHFRSVKTFSMTVLPAGKGIAYDPAPVSFDRLESLTIYSVHLSSVPLRLIADSATHLTAFSLPWLQDAYGVDYVVDMLGHMAHLKEVTVNWSPTRSFYNVVSLIGSFAAVEKITFVSWQLDGMDRVGSLIASIPFEWRVTSAGPSAEFGWHLTIEKKVFSSEKSRPFNPISKYWLGNDDRARYEDDVRA